jgi:hypothetical protein
VESTPVEMSKENASHKVENENRNEIKQTFQTFQTCKQIIG